MRTSDVFWSTGPRAEEIEGGQLVALLNARDALSSGLAAPKEGELFALLRRLRALLLLLEGEGDDIGGV